MARYAADSRDKVRDAVDMVDLVSTRTELRRAGANRYEGLCPFHEERTPSFGIDPEQKLYHCFGCGAGGDCFTFVQETEGLDFKGTLEWLAGRYGVELELDHEDPEAAERRRVRERLLEVLERASVFYVRYLWDSQEAAPAREYLASRGLEESALREFRVGYAPSAWDTLLSAGHREGFSARELFDAGLAVRAKGEGRVYDRFRRRIMFPLCDLRGHVVGFGARALGADQQPKYLNSPDGIVYRKGRHLFGADIARTHAARSGEVVVAEGYTDVIALHQAGVRNAVGLMGTALTEEQVGELARLANTVLLALDADSAGQEAMLRGARLAQSRRLELRVVPLPAGRDPADLVAEEGAKAAQQLIESAVPFVSFRVERELEQGDLDSAEGKDRVIDALAPVFATLAPSALREELLRRVADATDLAPSMVSSWLPAPGQPTTGSPPARQGSAGKGNGAPRAAAADPTSRSERAFLAQCIAAPDAGAAALAQAGDDAFSSDLHRRAAAHLRAHLRDPGAGLPPDEDVVRLVAALDAAASKMHGSHDAVQGQLRELWIAREEHLMDVDRREGRADITDRRKRIEAWTRERDEFIGRSMEATRSADA